MKTFFYTAAVIITVIFFACYSSELISQRTTGQVKVDGKLTEWDKNAFISIEDDVLYMAAERDEQYYYLAGEFSDRTIGRLFAMGGITLLINPDGDKEKNLEMTFALPGRKHIDYSKGGFFQQLDKGQQKIVAKKMDEMTNAVTVVDTASLSALLFMEGGRTDFQGHMLIENDRLTFELKVPFHIDRYFPDFIPLNKESMFCIKPAFTGRMGVMPLRRQGSQRPEEFNRKSPARTEFWFQIVK